MRYSGTAARSIAQVGVEIGGGWNVYTAVVGGDLNGDGRGDLVARDAGGLLWRYPMTAGGSVENTRTQIGGGWNDYTAMG